MTLFARPELGFIIGSASFCNKGCKPRRLRIRGSLQSAGGLSRRRNTGLWLHGADGVSLPKGPPFSPFGYPFAAFPQPFPENHFGVLFLCGNIQHDTPRNSSFSSPAPPSFTRRRGALAMAGPSPVQAAFLLFTGLP